MSTVDEQLPRHTASLVTFAGHGPKSIGAICDPTAFTGVVEISPGILGPRDGQITVSGRHDYCRVVHLTRGVLSRVRYVYGKTGMLRPLVSVVAAYTADLKGFPFRMLWPGTELNFPRY
jgi:hypothetical protein